MLFKTVLRGTCALAIVVSGELCAQRSTLHTDGIVRVKGGDWRNTRITVMPEYGGAFEVPLTSDHFDLDMGLLSTYLVRASHDDCATKEIVFDLWVPAAYRNAEFHFPFEVLLEVFKPKEEPYSYEHPIGAVFFDEAKGDFTYTTDYSSIQRARSLPTLVERMNTHISLHPRPVDELAAYEALFAHDPNAASPPETPPATGPVALPASRDTTAAPPAAASPASSAPLPAPERATPVAPVSAPSPPASVPVPAMDPATKAGNAHDTGTFASGPMHTTAVPVPAPLSSSAPARTGPSPTSPAPKPVRAAAAPLAASEVRRAKGKGRTSHMSTRLEVPSTEKPPGSHELNVLPTMVIVIDRFGKGTTSTELRKVTHAYGAVFYFQDGAAITERTYRQLLAEFELPPDPEPWQEHGP